jgi:hypothetical protein
MRRYCLNTTGTRILPRFRPTRRLGRLLAGHVKSNSSVIPGCSDKPCPPAMPVVGVDGTGHPTGLDDPVV